MSLYADQLKDDGMPASRTQDVADAMGKLHSALCRLDAKALKAFVYERDLLSRLNEYAETEELWSLDDTLNPKVAR